MALNCPNRDRDSGDPCGECESCLRIWNGGTSLDVVEIDAASNRGRGRRAGAAGARHVRGLAGRPPQGLHRGRGPHADPRGLERAAQDPGGAAAGGGVRVRHHRAAEDRGHRRAGALATTAIRLPADRPRRHPRPPAAGARRRRHRRGRGCPDSDRAAGGRRHARRALGARPVPQLRRGCGHRRPGARRARAGRATSSTPRRSDWWRTSARRASSHWWTAWWTRART